MDSITTLEATARWTAAVRRTDMLRNLIHASHSKSVSTVIIDGRVVLDRGVFPHLDETDLLARIDQAAQQLLRRMGVVAVSEWVDRRAMTT